MLKEAKRKATNSQSWRCFVNQVRYITNQHHAHHYIKKVVLEAINYACAWGQSAKDFIKAVHETQDLWAVRKRKKKGGGNPTQDIFFELVYSAPAGVRTTPEERDAIDKIITAPFLNCPIRRGWHLAAWDLAEEDRPDLWKPLDDAHYLISARDNFGNATISSRFGDGRETLESWMRRMDEEICDMLNQTREKQYDPVRSKYICGLEKKLGIKLTKLHEMIAQHTAEPVTRENLADIVEAMERPSVKEPGKMVPVAKVTNKDRILADDKLVWVHFTDRLQPSKYRIKKLLLDIAETQLEIELSRPGGREEHERGVSGESGGGTCGMGGVSLTPSQLDSLVSPAIDDPAEQKDTTTPPPPSDRQWLQIESPVANPPRRRRRKRSRQKPKWPSDPEIS